MGIKNLFKNTQKEIFRDERGRKVTLGDLTGTGYKYQIMSDFFTKNAFNDGKHIGKKEGYVQASYEYEKKLLEQAEEFLNQKKDFYSQSEEYENLLDQYERYIDEITVENNLSEQEKDYMNKIMIMERKLKKLK